MKILIKHSIILSISLIILELIILNILFPWWC